MLVMVLWRPVPRTTPSTLAGSLHASALWHGLRAGFGVCGEGPSLQGGAELLQAQLVMDAVSRGILAVFHFASQCPKTAIRASAVEMIKKHHFAKGPAPYPTRIQVVCSTSTDPQAMESKGEGRPYESVKPLGL